MRYLSCEVGPALTRSYLFIDDENQSAVWIDPAPGSAKWIDETLPPEFELQGIYLTHSHWDHIADIGHSQRFQETPIYLHRNDYANLAHPGADQLKWPAGVNKPHFNDSKSDPIGTGLCHFIEEGDQWKLGEESFTVLHTPGHTMGCCVFFHEKSGLLISGDTLFATSFGRVDFPLSSPKAMLHSLRRLQALTGVAYLLPGHGEIVSRSELHWLDSRFGPQ